MQNLYINIFVPIFLTIVMNIYIFSNKINQSTIQNNLLPPGYLVGTIWIILFGIFGYLHWSLYNINNKETNASKFIILLTLFCILYPLFTQLKPERGQVLNLVTLILAFILFILVRDETNNSELKYLQNYTIPLLLWAIYVNYADKVYCSNNLLNQITSK